MEIEQVARRLKLKDLRILRAVAETGSMAKAARLAGISQPAISKAVAEMENALGAPLVERSARGVELTDGGRAFVRRTRVILDEVEQGIAEFTEIADPAQGLVRIGTTESNMAAVAEVIEQLGRRFPRITFEVIVSDARAVIGALRDRTADVVVARWLQQTGADDLEAVSLYSEPFVVLADRKHPLTKRRKLELADVIGERWTLSPPDSFRPLAVSSG